MTTIAWLSGPLIEATSRQTAYLIETLGYQPTVTTSESGLRNYFRFTSGGRQYATLIVLACTGLGSMTIFAGLIAAVEAPRRRKPRALAVSVPVIWALKFQVNPFALRAWRNCLIVASTSSKFDVTRSV